MNGWRLWSGLVVIVALSGPAANAAAYTPADNRATEIDYAKAHNMDLDALASVTSATGRIDCGTVSGTADITMDARVIVTAEHVVCDATHGRRTIPTNSCRFSYGADHDRSIVVERIFESGGECSGVSLTDDWIVLILKRRADGPKPYKITPLPMSFFETIKDLHLIGDHAVDFREKDEHGPCMPRRTNSRGSKCGGFLLPKHVSDCKIRGFVPAKDESRPVQLLTDCASGAGDSGGAVLSDDLRHPILIAILRGVTTTKAEENRERATGMPIIKPYSDDYKHPWLTIAIPVQGPFANAIERAVRAVGGTPPIANDGDMNDSAVERKAREERKSKPDHGVPGGAE